jgi:hypothetical protein
MSAGDARPVYVVCYHLWPAFRSWPFAVNATTTAMPFDTANEAAAYNKVAGLKDRGALRHDLSRASLRIGKANTRPLVSSVTSRK